MRRVSLRYNVIVALAALATALAGFGGWRYARASAPISGPIVLISIDTLRADHLAAYGYRAGTTPAIDALAADGVVFEHAYAHATETHPAHLAILSGRLPLDVTENVRFLAQLLGDRGYATGAVVSSAALGRESGLTRGFDFVDDRIAPPNAGSGEAAVERAGAESEAIAEHWLDSSGTARAFLFLHINEPHAPYAPPGRFAELAPYDGEIAAADEAVGRLVKYLKAHQLYDRSTIVLVSDHGEGLGDHGEQQHGLFVYREALHVPLIVKMAAGEGAGRRVADLVQHVDLVPTILDLVKAPLPGGLRGRSLKPLVEGTGREAAPFVYAQAMYGRDHFGTAPLASAIDGRFHYILAPREELYDLQRDPRETTNLIDAAEAREARASLAAAVAKLPAETATSPVDPKDVVDLVERYRAAEALARERKWAQAIASLQQIARRDDSLPDVWLQLADNALRLERYEQAADDYARAAALRPSDPAPLLGGASALLKARRLDEARELAAAALERAGCREPFEKCPPAGRADAAAAHALLARIAVSRHDADEARQHAAAARAADGALPMPAFVDARLLLDQGRFEEALPLFEQTIAEAIRAGRPPIADAHLYAGDALVKLDRADEAVQQYSEEIRAYPQNTRAHAALVSVYQARGLSEDAGHAIEAMLDAAPTPDSYALAARLWRALGNRRQADAVRAEARRAFPAEPLRPSDTTR